MVRGHGYADCIVLVELFVALYEVENQHLEVVKHADLHCMEEVGHREIAHNTGNISKTLNFR